MSNSLDPDQAQHFVGLDLGPNCLQSLSAEETSRQALEVCSLVQNDSFPIFPMLVLEHFCKNGYIII